MTPLAYPVEGIEISNGRHGEVANAMAMWDGLLVAVEVKAPAAAAALPGYIRFELLRADGSAAAYTNPVYLVR